MKYFFLFETFPLLVINILDFITLTTGSQFLEIYVIIIYV